VWQKSHANNRRRAGGITGEEQAKITGLCRLLGLKKPAVFLSFFSLFSQMKILIGHLLSKV
jgi:hypothetical protein